MTSGAKTQGFVEWENDLIKAARDALDDGKKIVGQGCNNIKKEWRFRWQGYPRIKHLPRTITYDVTVPATNRIVGTCGVDKALPQGPLGHLIEYGSINNAPIPGGLPALANEEPRFLKYVGDMGEGLLAPGPLSRPNKAPLREVVGV